MTEGHTVSVYLRSGNLGKDSRHHDAHCPFFYSLDDAILCMHACLYTYAHRDYPDSDSLEAGGRILFCNLATSCAIRTVYFHYIYFNCMKGLDKIYVVLKLDLL